MITKNQLLQEANLALENNACLLLNAGDYFTDYAKIVLPYVVENFIEEVECFGTNVEEYYEPHVAIHSIDIVYGGTREKNEYYIRDAKAVPLEEVEALLSLVDL